MLTAGDADSTTAITYDGLGRVSTVTSVYAAQPGVSMVFTYGYDANGQLTSLAGTWDGETTVEQAYQYDDLGRLTRITDLAGGRRVDFAYNLLGQYVTVRRYSDSAGTSLVATSTYGYDEAGRLTSLIHSLGSQGSTTLTYSFVLDAAGQITDLLSPDGDSAIGYDNQGQLTSASLTDESYAYDASGNRTSGSSQTGEDNRLLEDATYTYAYDNEGNLITRTRKDGTETVSYTWDYRNRLTEVTVLDGENAVVLTAGYVYDPFDRRIARTVSGSQNVEEQYLYPGTDNDNAVLVLDGDGQPTHRYLYGRQANEVFSEDVLDDGEVTASRWALTDQEGSVRDVVDDSGAVVDHIVYDSFGKVVSQSCPADAMAQGYTGAIQDAETGWIYLDRRYMDPGIGRFTSQDPIGFAAGDANLYRYVGNSPLTHTDPTGLCAEGESTSFWSYLPGEIWKTVWGGLKETGLRAADCGNDIVYLATWGRVGYRGSLSQMGQLMDSGKTTVLRATGSAVPVFGSGYNFITGNDLLTGQKLSDVDRVASGFSMLSQGASIVAGGLSRAGSSSMIRTVATPTSVVSGDASVIYESGVVSGEVKAFGNVVGPGSAVEGEPWGAPAKAAAEARGGTYLLRDAETGQVMRTGRTNDLLRREAEHARDPLLKDYEFEPVHRTDIYEEQRGLEQKLYDQYNPPLNRIRPISPRNPKLSDYLDAARRYLNQ